MSLQVVRDQLPVSARVGELIATKPTFGRRGRAGEIGRVVKVQDGLLHVAFGRQVRAVSPWQVDAVVVLK